MLTFHLLQETFCPGTTPRNPGPAQPAARREATVGVDISHTTGSILPRHHPQEAWWDKQIDNRAIYKQSTPGVGGLEHPSSRWPFIEDGTVLQFFCCFWILSKVHFLYSQTKLKLNKQRDLPWCFFREKGEGTIYPHPPWKDFRGNYYVEICRN